MFELVRLSNGFIFAKTNFAQPCISFLFDTLTGLHRASECLQIEILEYLFTTLISLTKFTTDLFQFGAHTIYTIHLNITLLDYED